MKFNHRSDAGQILAKRISKEEWAQARVLALPRGGVPVAAPIAKRLGVPLEVLLVRKLGAPLQPEFALGALVEDGTIWLNESAIRFEAVKTSELEAIKNAELKRIEEQKEKFRAGKGMPEVEGRPVMIVDDGIATGSTVLAAIASMKKHKASRIGVAVPVCAASTALEIRNLGVELITLLEPERLISVGMWYQDFSQVEDEEVIRDLAGEPHSRALQKPSLAKQIAERLMPLQNEDDLAPLLQKIRNKQAVMLGESSHGTSEFYSIRNRISKYLLRNEGFSFVAVEGDWPDSEKLNRYLKNGKARSAKEAMKAFKRWPTWLWANEEVADFIENEKQYGKSSFYGLDVYSLFESIDSVIDYTTKVNPFLGGILKKRYSCFEPFERDEYAYARSLQRFPEGCATEVISNLNELLKSRLEPGEKADERFSAEQNARIVVNAENYYRALLSSDERSWNVRDGHMLDTLDVLFEHCKKRDQNPKGIVWAHNTHVGDYRATDMLDEGYVNLGGLARQLYGANQVALVGFGTHSGKVIASNAWGGREQVVSVPPAAEGSWDAYFHEALELKRWKQGYVLFEESDHSGVFSEVLGQRAIGVVYHPRQEQHGNYVPTSLSRRYDAFVFVDSTSPLHSLHGHHDHGKFPETWPKGV